jgi:hypothetical protein
MAVHGFLIAPDVNRSNSGERSCPSGRERLQLGLGTDAVNLISSVSATTNCGRKAEVAGVGDHCPSVGDTMVRRVGVSEAGPWISGGR